MLDSWRDVDGQAFDEFIMAECECEYDDIDVSVCACVSERKQEVTPS